MNKVLDNGLVALVVIASVAYALASLGPKRRLRRVWAGLARLAASASPRLHLGGIARRLERAAAKSAGSCAQCANCEPAPAVRGKSPSAEGRAVGGRFAQVRGSEIRVPLEHIGKR
jgi:hypothetical protein